MILSAADLVRCSNEFVIIQKHGEQTIKIRNNNENRAIFGF